MYGILAEDDSDVNTLKTFIRRLNKKSTAPSFRAKGYRGCGDLLRKGARDLRMLAEECTRFVVCYDSDRDDQDERRQSVMDKVIIPANLTQPTCVLVPVQEIEAWLLSDLTALAKVIPRWRGNNREILHPESQNDPKEALEALTRERGRPLYVNTIHNAKIAEHIDLETVHRKCPSFRPLGMLVQNGEGNTVR
ncbi:DUF4276 family protein [Achromobacter sp. JD417]|uniref:DUF4276 family protein n=1 Tax=Achromobacter sp. JD417 TaxID=2893881 RepID=UPI0035A58056